MTKEEKDLLLKDLCGRLPYGVFCNMGLDHPLLLQSLSVDKLDGILLDFYEDGKDYQVYLSEVKPYLRPMSSMTEEEKKEYNDLMLNTQVSEIYFPDCEDIITVLDWLNAHHFDYRGLIPKDLALSTDEFNPYIDNLI